MLVVTTEIWPFGDQDNRQQLHQLCIVNDMTGDKVFGNYVVYDEWEEVVMRIKKHRRSLGAPALVKKVFDKCKF